MGVLFSFFSFSFLFLLQDVWECFAGQSSKRGTFLLEFCRGFLLCFCFFSSPRHPAFMFFSSVFFILFLFCGIAKEETDLPVQSCHLLSLTHKIIFSFPPLSSPSSKWLVFELILTQSLFGLSWRGTECKPEHTRNQECNCLSSCTGTKSISLPFGPCTFSSKEVNPGTGTQAWENRRPESPPALCSLGMISAHAAWLKHSP